MVLAVGRVQVRIAPVSINKIEILKKAELFSGLGEDVLKLLASRAVEKRLDRGEVLFVAGEPAEGLYVVVEGSVRAFRTGLDGREQVIHVERAVTTIAEVPVFDEGAYPSTVAAEEPAVLLLIPKRDIRNICVDRPELALAATRLLARRLRKCAELVESLSLREVGQRIAKLLLERVDAKGRHSNGTVEITLDLTHNQLAARIGTVREVVSRSLLRLQSQGLIAVKGKKIVISDLAGLRAYEGSG